MSFANLRRIQKRLGCGHTLARKLWASGNADAQALALMVADPKAMSSQELDRWVSHIQYYVLADIFATHMASRTRFAKAKIGKWTNSRNEWIGRAGGMLVASAASNDKGLPDRHFEGFLARIEKEIHQARNMTRHAMKSALIAIGLRNKTPEKHALALARRIGKVEVDHGETFCKTPDAGSYILNARRRGRKAR